MNEIPSVNQDVVLITGTEPGSSVLTAEQAKTYRQLHRMISEIISARKNKGKDVSEFEKRLSYAEKLYENDPEGLDTNFSMHLEVLEKIRTDLQKRNTRKKVN